MYNYFVFIKVIILKNILKIKIQKNYIMKKHI